MVSYGIKRLMSSMHASISMVLGVEGGPKKEKKTSGQAKPTSSSRSASFLPSRECKTPGTFMAAAAPPDRHPVTNPMPVMLDKFWRTLQISFLLPLRSMAFLFHGDNPGSPS